MEDPILCIHVCIGTNLNGLLKTMKMSNKCIYSYTLNKHKIKTAPRKTRKMNRIVEEGGDVILKAPGFIPDIKKFR